MKFEVDSDVPLGPKSLDALADRMADAVIAGRYPSARKAAVENVVEYAGSETNVDVTLNSRVGNFAKKITITLVRRGYDKFGQTIE